MRAPLTSTSTQFLANHDRPAVTGAHGLFSLDGCGRLTLTLAVKTRVTWRRSVEGGGHQRSRGVQLSRLARLVLEGRPGVSLGPSDRPDRAGGIVRHGVVLPGVEALRPRRTKEGPP